MVMEKMIVVTRENMSFDHFAQKIKLKIQKCEARQVNVS